MQSGSGLSPWALAENHREVAYGMARTLKCGSQSKIPEPENCTQYKDDEQKYEGCIVDQMSSKEIFQCLKEAPMEMLIALPFTFCVSIKNIYLIPTKSFVSLISIIFQTSIGENYIESVFINIMHREKIQ